MMDLERNNKKLSAAENDPFKGYPYGILAYFRTLRHLMICYLVITLLAGVNIYIFTTGDSLESGRNKLVASTTMGNLGFT